jgi:Mn2+/Fe2+ NRAMP family transporter
MSAAHDPYALRPEAVEEPPRTLLGGLRRLGPGLVLAACIVGSGELIATTTLGAQVGYALLWMVLLSCAIKPVVQAELGRYTVASGETGLEALDRVPGPRLGVSWLVWMWAAVVFLTLLQIGGMFGGVSQVMHLLVPAVPVRAWVVGFAALTLVLLLGGGYERIERFAFLKIGLFALVTVLAAVVLTRMPQYFSWADALAGLQPSLPAQGLATAVAVFGITGVGANELVMYPYWCIEKGYARYVGRREDGEAWRARARGWIRVMHVDIGASLVVYTVATVAFYLLGAGILFHMGKVPASSDMIPTLSSLYTQTLGPWALWLFYAGAVVTLYGTVFASNAANSRIYADMCRLLGLFSREDHERRVALRRVFLVLLTVVPAAMYLVFESPVKMVVAGGLAQSALLPALGAGTLHLHHRCLPRDVAPSRLVTAGLWLATLGMAAVTGYSLFLAAGA